MEENMRIMTPISMKRTEIKEVEIPTSILMQVRVLYAFLSAGILNSAI